jgi:DNA polymerase-3 subunit epsilon
MRNPFEKILKTFGRVGFRTEVFVDDLEWKKVAERLAQSENYRVLERLVLQSEYNGPDPNDEIVIGAALDTETTGLDWKTDKILEIGVVLFEYGRKTGKIYRILDIIDQFEDPGFPIPAEITELTHITDEMVAGKHFDDAQINGAIAKAGLIIAFNAQFDRKFLDVRLPIFQEKYWACAYTQIDWQKEGLRCNKLDYISMKYGFFVDAHRACDDAAAMIHILSRPLLKSGELGVATLLRNARKPVHRLYAKDAPFEAKDTLKGRGYIWNDWTDGKTKAWWTLVYSDTVGAEREYLAANIYPHKSDNLVKLVPIHLMNRFSVRE